jgi:hypothetical protein
VDKQRIRIFPGIPAITQQFRIRLTNRIFGSAGFSPFGQEQNLTWIEQEYSREPGFQEHVYSNRPEVTPFQNRIFENSVLYLVGAGILNSRFYKDIYLDKFGTIEDVQIGGIFSVTAGTEKREFNDRWYIGADAAYSRRLAFGYISAAVSLGGFRNRDIWEQNVFSAKLMYHSPLQLLNGWKQRLLVKADYLLGFNRFAGEVVYIDNENGLRGLSRFVVSGTKRTVLNIESRFFSPYSLLGFDLGGVLFADLGLIGGKKI